MPVGGDEAAWSRAKAAIVRQYPEISRESDKFWRLVQHVYQNIQRKTGSVRKAGEPGTAGTVVRGAQRKVVGRVQFGALRVAVELEAGSYRAGVDRDGTPWQVRMNWAYGYLVGTEGEDGEGLDCYLGPDPTAPCVYVVRQLRPDTGDWDEDKILLGFRSMDEARTAYLMQYSDEAFFGGIREIPLDAFEALLRVQRGKRILALSDPRYLEHVTVSKAGGAAAGVKNPKPQLVWEPPGGNHPLTWRAWVGDHYEYLSKRPGEGTDTTDTTPESTYTPGEFRKQREGSREGLRAVTIGMTPEEHENAANAKGTPRLLRDFHRSEAEMKRDEGPMRALVRLSLASLKQPADDESPATKAP